MPELVEAKTLKNKNEIMLKAMSCDNVRERSHSEGVTSSCNIAYLMDSKLFRDRRLTRQSSHIVRLSFD